MRKLISLAIGTALLAAPASAKPKMTPEAKLAKAIEGRVAGEPVNCINVHNLSNSIVIDKTAIIYDAGSTIYVNRPRSGAEDLNQWDTLVTKSFGSRLCNVDIVEMYDLHAGMQTGLVFLGEFVPYKKPRK